MRNIPNSKSCNLKTERTVIINQTGASGPAGPGFGPFTYKLGQTGPGGGFIFFVDIYDQYPGFAYLEAAPAHSSTGIAWCSDTTTLLGLDGWYKRAVGRGQANTTNVITNQVDSAGRPGDDLPRPLRQLHRRAETLKRFNVKRRAQREVDLVGASQYIFADAIDNFVGAAHQHARLYALCQRAELLFEALLCPGNADVDRASDLARVAANFFTVHVQHLALVGEGLGADERNVPTVGILGGDVQRALLAAAADPDRQFLLHRSRLALGVVHRKIFA